MMLFDDYGCGHMRFRFKKMFGELILPASVHRLKRRFRHRTSPTGNFAAHQLRRSTSFMQA